MNISVEFKLRISCLGCNHNHISPQLTNNGSCTSRFRAEHIILQIYNLVIKYYPRTVEHLLFMPKIFVRKRINIVIGFLIQFVDIEKFGKLLPTK